MLGQQTSKVFRDFLSFRRLGKLPAHIFSRSFRTSILSSNESNELSKEPGSLFRTSSTWDYVFQDLDKLPPLSPSAIRKSIQKPHTYEEDYRGRKQTMTMQEAATVAKMFRYVFNENINGSSSSRDPLANVGLGFGPGRKTKVEQILEKLDRAQKEKKERAERENSIDRLQERIETFQTDIELLQWAYKDVFHIDPSSRSGETASEPYDHTYGMSITLLMRAFRDNFRDPHIALSIFHHAKYLSIESFVSGCTSSSYHEYIVTIWSCFRDLSSVCDVLEEMNINGISPESSTRKFAEAIRHEVLRDNPLEDTSDFKFEVMRLVTKMDSLLAKKRGSKTSANEPWKEGWKVGDERKGYEFGNWDDYAGKEDLYTGKEDASPM